MALRENFENTGNFLFRWRSYLPLLILPLIALAIYRIGFIEKNFGEMAGDIYTIVCVAVSFLGLFIRCYTVGYAPEGTSGRNTDGQRADTLNKTGIYKAG
ncbi:hypothetical protein DRQ26_04165 [bacterium]|nr:MAG: hypothetical protein DRQ26_04165 [bacterium]